MIQLFSSSVPIFEGCHIASTPTHYDRRGSFIKTYNSTLFNEFWPSGITLRETFLSRSKMGVLRGFHFQVPPHQQWKVVCCLEGETLDVLLDLRVNSATFQKTWAIKLTAATQGKGEQAMTVVIPPGVAHAFYTLSSSALLFYGVSEEYVPDSDKGVLWSSVDFDWPSMNPVLSDRDADFPELRDFCSPF
ncbi:MAG: dTDP-4-keto-6-deoxy-D-glucose epimerase [Deltaproteobacteria bacterium]|nr:dTDP-4-keto-6-deoxy-D-glucose epimerase [Deltaproteobacteria bacterium]